MKIELCMGSSCFTRGNREILEILETYLQESPLEPPVELAGAHCLGDCSRGPIIRIDGTPYQGIHPSCILDILRYHLEGHS